MSIRTKFLIAVGAFAVVFAVLGFLRTWFSIRRHTEDLTARQAELALQFDIAIRKYIGDEVRPLMEQRVGKDEFIPQAMSTSFVARSVFEEVRKAIPDCVIKFSSDNPRNPVNAAGPEELQILTYFREHPEATQWSGEIVMNGKECFVQCIPRRMDASCLRCHGRPEDAPASLIATYGPTAGFGRSAGEVVALDTVAIPLDKVNAAIAADVRTQLGVLAGGIVVLSVGSVLVFRFLVGDRLAAISNHFKNAACQPEDMPLTPVAVKAHDEIGVLAASFNALAARLLDIHSSLENRVQERTASLRAEIAERKRVEKALQLAHFSVDQTADAVFWLDPLGRVVYVNKTACQVLEYTAEEFRSMTVHDIDPLFPKEVWPDHWEELRRKKSFVIQSIHRAKSGRLIPVEIAVNHIECDGNEYNCAFARDITARELAHKELAKAKEGAEAANQAKSEFLANMSHEIRTPMTAILGYIDVLASGCRRQCPFSQSEIGDPLQVISQNARHLLQIIDDVLDLSKIEAGKVAVEQVSFSPRTIIAEVASLMQVRAAAKGLPLRVEYRGQLPERIESDPTRLRQILMNLVGNAVKFTEAGEVRLVTSLEAAKDGAPRLEIRVIDTGIGMPEDVVGRLFKPFTQADTSTSRRFGGTGLGLTISQRLAHLLGGSLSATSTEGKGSVFTVSIPTGPLEGVRLLDAPSEADAQCEEIPRRPGNESARLEYGRVLLVEDSPDNQRLIGFLLRKAGAEVTVAENGRAAVEAALASRRDGKPFHVVFMDMQMPVMDGYEATRTLRAEGWSGPIVALTAHAMKEDRQKCLDAGCDDYMAKPIDRNALVEMVANHLGHGPATCGQDERVVNG